MRTSLFFWLLSYRKWDWLWFGVYKRWGERFCRIAHLGQRWERAWRWEQKQLPGLGGMEGCWSWKGFSDKVMQGSLAPWDRECLGVRSWRLHPKPLGCKPDMSLWCSALTQVQSFLHHRPPEELANEQHKGNHKSQMPGPVAHGRAIPSPIFCEPRIEEAFF